MTHNAARSGRLDLLWSTPSRIAIAVFVAALLVASLFGALQLTGTHSPEITTDKFDYDPNELVTMTGGEKAVTDIGTYTTRKDAKAAVATLEDPNAKPNEAPKHTLSVDDGPIVAGKIAPSKAPTKAKAKPRKKKA